MKRKLDLCACEGAGGDGYARAGFTVYAVDLDKNRLKHNPHPSHHGDALVVLVTLLEGGRVPFTHRDGTVEWLALHDFDAIHVSPPCQGYTRGNAGRVTAWPKLIPDFRALLERTGLPYVIENVADAAPHMLAPVALCGCMFGLSTTDDDGTRLHLQRLRLFESNVPLTAPRPCEGEGRPRREHPSQEWVAGVYGGARRDRLEARYVRRGGYVPPSHAVASALLGVNRRLTWQGLYECLPPAYTEHLGRQLLAHLEEAAA